MRPKAAEGVRLDDCGRGLQRDVFAEWDVGGSVVHQHPITGADLHVIMAYVGIEILGCLLDLDGARHLDAPLAHDCGLAIRSAAKTFSLSFPKASISTIRCVVGSSSVRRLSAHNVSRNGTSRSASCRFRWLASERMLARRKPFVCGAATLIGAL